METSEERVTHESRGVATSGEAKRRDATRRAGRHERLEGARVGGVQVVLNIPAVREVAVGQRKVSHARGDRGVVGHVVLHQDAGLRVRDTAGARQVGGSGLLPVVRARERGRMSE